MYSAYCLLIGVFIRTILSITIFNDLFRSFAHDPFSARFFTDIETIVYVFLGCCLSKRCSGVVTEIRTHGQRPHCDVKVE